MSIWGLYSCIFIRVLNSTFIVGGFWKLVKRAAPKQDQTSKVRRCSTSRAHTHTNIACRRQWITLKELFILTTQRRWQLLRRCKPQAFAFIVHLIDQKGQEYKLFKGWIIGNNSGQMGMQTCVINAPCLHRIWVKVWGHVLRTEKNKSVWKNTTMAVTLTVSETLPVLWVRLCISAYRCCLVQLLCSAAILLTLYFSKPFPWHSANVYSGGTNLLNYRLETVQRNLYKCFTFSFAQSKQHYI